MGMFVDKEANKSRVFVKTLGCKVNTFDSHAIYNQLAQRGFVATAESENADVTVINSCSVTAEAEREARYLARRYRRDNPSTLIVVTGCYAQTDSKALADQDDINLVVPNTHKQDLADHISERLQLWQKGISAEKIPSHIPVVENNRQSHFKSSVTFFDEAATQFQTRAFVKIQDGCNNFCTYCIIPYARGASRSVKPDVALQEIRRLVNAGIPEIVLTGIHIGDYGADLGIAKSFPDFINDIFSLEGLVRLRISSLEPCEVSSELLQVLAQHRDKFCDHFHLPLQSGDDNVLRRMRRQYDASQYAETVAAIRNLFPKAAIGADVIPGFPGEKDEQHINTIEFIETCGLNYLHVFPYSSRPNTAAAKMPNHIRGDIIKKRASDLRALSQQRKDSFYSQFIEQTARVVWEQTSDDSGRILGTSRNYLSVVAASDFAKVGTESLVRIKGRTPAGHLLGVLA